MPQTEAFKIGLISFSDGRKRVHEDLRPTIVERQRGLETVLRDAGAEPVVAQEVVHTPRLAVREARRLAAADVAGVVFNIPVFAFPSFSAIAARVLEKPVAVLSPGEPELPGMGGLLASGGALEQMGMLHERIWGPYESEGTRRRLATFVRAAGARHRLVGQVYGQIGGRSIGMLTGVSSSPAEWLRVFGVDIDHADESEILRIAETVGEDEREGIVDWLEANLRGVHYGESPKLTRENLKFQAACAAAVKRTCEQRQFDFIGVKCHYDMSEYYCTQCLSAAFLPSRVDWDGPKKPVACACEADGDGALTMQILQLISGCPALFLDLRHYDRESDAWTLCNCGGQSNFYAERSEDPGENLRRVELVPVISKYGGVGAHVRYVGSPGPLTFARIQHDEQEPALVAFTGEAVPAEEGWLEQSCPAWPHIFAKTEVEPETLLEELHANHVHAAAGSWVEELKSFARMVDIPFAAL
ncbi:MAG: L-fucose/L-arabinose isomerase family protein [Planctomycetota bacterium]